MKIEDSSIRLSSQHSITEKEKVRESVRMWVGDQRPDFEGQESSTPDKRIAVADVIALSSMATTTQPAGKVDSHDSEEGFDPTPEMRMVRLIIEKMLGIKIKLSSIKVSQDDGGKVKKSKPVEAAVPEGQQRQGFGVEYDYHRSHYESEKISFSGRGVIKTADGEAISFKVKFKLSREFVTEQNTSVRLGDAVRLQDPLVINFGGDSAQLTSAKFSFDLDMDGRADSISSLIGNSGFLAIDRNNDNRINNGGELFGPETGQGFRELARYDSDNNNWIDENDQVYDQLRIWTRDSSGNDSLASLKQKDVGAIYLGHQSTRFEINNGQNIMQGQLNSSGIYVSEGGSVGTIQQVDLTM